MTLPAASATSAPVSAGVTAAPPASAESLPAQRSLLSNYINLTKPRLTLLAAIISAAGSYLAFPGPARGRTVWMAFFATFVLSAGAMVLNQYLERDTDALMRRTSRRPIPTGQVSPAAAFWYGIFLSVAGIVWLTFGAGLTAGAVGAFSLASYVMIYTPMKRLSSFNTIVGAVPGAMPPVIGYAVTADFLDFEAALLFAIMFLWQLPHFLAIAWICRDDYARAGMPMLPVLDREGGFTARQVVLYSLALLLISPLPAVFGLTGWVYGFGAVVSGIAFLVLGLRWLVKIDTLGARRVFIASLIHVTLLFLLMVLDKR